MWWTTRGPGDSAWQLGLDWNDLTDLQAKGKAFNELGGVGGAVWKHLDLPHPEVREPGRKRTNLKEVACEGGRELDVLDGWREILNAAVSQRAGGEVQELQSAWQSLDCFVGPAYGQHHV